MTGRVYHEIEDTVYFHFGANNTSGSGDDGASPAADVRLAGAAAGAAPVLSPTPILLTHVNFPPGTYELAVAATVANGFAADNTYAVFATLLVDSQNPTGFLGSFTLSPVLSNPWDEFKGDHNTWDTFGHSIQGLVPITGKVADATPASQGFDSDGYVEASNDHFNGHVLVFTSGALLGQARIISDFLGTNQELTFNRAFTEAPADNDEFVILGPLGGGISRLINTDTVGRADANVERWLDATLNALVSGRVDSIPGAMATDVITAGAIQTNAIGAAELADDGITKMRSVIDGTADSGSTTTLVDTAGIGTATDDEYWTGSWVLFTSGTLDGQIRLITAFAQASNQITFAPAATQAVGTHTYEILPAGAVDIGQWLSETPSALVSGRVDSSVGAMVAGIITATVIATDAIDADAVATDAENAIADAILTRDVDVAESGAPKHSLLVAILKAVSRIRDNAGTLEVYETDGTTLKLSQTVTTDASADPVDELTVGV